MARGICELEFEGTKLSLDLIINQVTKLTGLTVVVENHDEDNINFNVFIAFKEFPNCILEIELEELVFPGIEEQPANNEKNLIVETLIPGSGNYVINIIGIIGKEPTLFDAIRSSLIDLGGKQKFPENYKELGRIKFPVIVKELQGRHKRHNRKVFLKLILTIILSPVILLGNLLLIIYQLIKPLFRMPALLMKKLWEK